MFIGFVGLEIKQWFSACARISLARLPTEAARKLFLYHFLKETALYFAFWLLEPVQCLSKTFLCLIFCPVTQNIILILNNLVPRAFSSTIFKMADRREKTPTSSPGPSPRRFSKWRIAARRPWPRQGHVVQNLQNSWRFLSRDILRKAKTKWRRSIAWAAKYRSKNALTLYARQWWLRRKIKYYFNGCCDSGAGLFSICKFIPLSYSLYF